MNRAYLNLNLKGFLLSRTRYKQPQSGMTLLELMISLSLGLLLLTGIGTIYVGSNQTYRVQEQNARLQESGRYALEIIGRSLRQAGYWNMPANPLSLQTGFSGTTLTGVNGSGTDADSLTVQYDALVGDQDCEGNNVAAAMVLQAAIQHDPSPDFELECESNNDGTAAVDPQPLVSNVEDIQFLFGIDPDGDQSANRYADASAVANWNQVVSVRACVLIRSEDQGIANSAQRFLNCANALAGTGTLSTAADTRLRRTFMATFNLRNRISITQ
jgi:type IV pilus assembly protein PilW